MRNPSQSIDASVTFQPCHSSPAGARWSRTGATAVLLSVALGCSAAPPPAPPPAPYVPTYTYQSAQPAATQAEISIAVIDPVVKGTVNDADGLGMLKALPSAFADLITAKGMKYRGPFESRDVMTFPDKKGSDLALYPEMEVDAGWQPVNVLTNQDVQKPDGTWIVAPTCDMKIATRGRVSFIVLEPLTGEVLWRKTVQIEPSEATVPGQSGEVCSMGPQQMGYWTMPGAPPPATSDSSPKPALEGEAGNVYRRALEAVFMATMKSIDAYMNVEEFETLRQQSQELREKKVFTGS